MTSNYQQRVNSLNRSLQFEQSRDQINQFADHDTYQNSVNNKQNRFSRKIQNNNHLNTYKNSMSCDRNYATLDESTLNYTNNSKYLKEYDQTQITPVKKFLISQMSKEKNAINNLANTSINGNFMNNIFTLNNNQVSLPFEQQKHYNPRKNNIKNSLMQVEKVYSQGLSSKVPQIHQVIVPGTSKERKNKFEIANFQNKILNEGAIEYGVKNIYHNILRNSTLNQNQENKTNLSSMKLTQNNTDSGIQQNHFSQRTQLQSNGNLDPLINSKESQSEINTTYQQAEQDRISNLTIRSVSKNNDNLNSAMSNNNCSSMVSYYDDTQNHSIVYNNMRQNQNNNILDNQTGRSIEKSSQNIKQNDDECEKSKNINKVQPNGQNKSNFKKNEINQIRKVKQNIKTEDTQSVSALYNQEQQNYKINFNQNKYQNDSISQISVTENNRYGDASPNICQQNSKINKSVQSIYTKQRKNKNEQNSFTQINGYTQNQGNRNNLSDSYTSIGDNEKFIHKENNLNNTFDCSLVDHQQTNFDYDVKVKNKRGKEKQSTSQKINSESGNSQNIQQSFSRNRQNHHQQLSLGNNIIALNLNNQTSKSINIVNRSSNFTTSTTQNKPKNRDFSYDSIQYDQLPSQVKNIFNFHPRNYSNQQYHTISHSSNWRNKERNKKDNENKKKIQLNSKVSNNNQINITTQQQNNTTNIVGDTTSQTQKQPSPDNTDHLGYSVTIQKNKNNLSQNSIPNQNNLLILQKVKDCFYRFKEKQEQLNDSVIDKIQMEEIINKYTQSEFIPKCNKDMSKSKLNETDICTPKELLIKPHINSQNKSDTIKGSKIESSQGEYNDQLTTLNSNNSQNTKQTTNKQTSASTIIINDNQQNNITLKFYKIGCNILTRLFKKKYSYQFFIQLIKESQQNNHVQC